LASTPDLAVPPVLPAGPRRWFGAVVVLLFVALPALVAGARLDAPAAARERVHLAQLEGVDGAPGTSEIARRFYSMTAGANSVDDELGRLAVARRAQVLGLFGLSGLLYLSVMLARGRWLGCLACVGLAATGPVFVDGHELRPETPAAVFAALSALLLVLLVRFAGRRNGTPSALAAGVGAGLAAALSLSSSNGSAVALLVPGTCMLLVTLVLVLRLVAVLRRHFLLVPRTALTRRLLPWLVASLAALAGAGLLLPEALDPGVAVVASSSPTGLWGDAAPWLGWSLCGVGVLAVGWRAGWSMGRRSRLSAEGALLVSAAVGIAVLGPRAAAGPDRDALVAAAGAGWLAAEGLAAAAMLARFTFYRSRHPLQA